MLILYNKYNGHKRENAKKIFFSSTIRVNPVKFWVLFPVNGFMHVLTNKHSSLYHPLSPHKVRAVIYVELF